MALSIKNPRTEEMARELARQQGKSVEEVIDDALGRQFHRATESPGDKTIETVLEAFDKLPALDDRKPDEILGYDEHGLP